MKNNKKKNFLHGKRRCAQKVRKIVIYCKQERFLKEKLFKDKNDRIKNEIIRISTKRPIE